MGYILHIFCICFHWRKLSEQAFIALEGPHVIHRQKLEAIWKLKIWYYACLRDEHLIFFSATFTPYQRLTLFAKRVFWKINAPSGIFWHSRPFNFTLQIHWSKGNKTSLENKLCFVWGRIEGHLFCCRTLWTRSKPVKRHFCAKPENAFKAELYRNHIAWFFTLHFLNLNDMNIFTGWTK